MQFQVGTNVIDEFFQYGLEFNAVLVNTSISSGNFYCNWLGLIIAAVAMPALDDLRKKALGKVRQKYFQSIRTIRKQLLRITAEKYDGVGR